VSPAGASDPGLSAEARQPPRNVILIGYRGCGKTSVGRLLATRLGWTLVDTDERIEAAAGRSIRDIFAQGGEAAFRRLEADAVAEVARGTRQVISVGGGAVLSEDNRRTLRAAGVRVWLTAPAEELYRRMRGDPRDARTRPALTGRGGLDEVRHLLAEREPLYAELADHVVPTGQRSVEQVVEAILAALGSGGSPEIP
jgi:shikimate kinase